MPYLCLNYNIPIWLMTTKTTKEKTMTSQARVLAVFAEWNKPSVQINADSLIDCWKKLKKDFPTFNVRNFDGVDIIYRDLSDPSGENDVESLAHGGVDFRITMSRMLKSYRARIKKQ